MFSSILAFRSG